MATERPSGIRPRCILRVGITGHRTEKLARQNFHHLEASIQPVMRLLERVTTKCHAENPEFFTSDAPELRLVTALADGTDTIAAEVAIENEYLLDVILPFPRATYVEKQELEDAKQEQFRKVLCSDAINSVFELSDGSDASLDDPEMYLAAGRSMLAYSDVIIAVWDGDREAGRGGTAQIVREAISRGIAVIWIPPSGSPRVLTDRDQFEHKDRAESLLSADYEPSEDIEALLVQRIAPPDLDEASSDRLRKFLAQPTPTSSSWSAYNLLRSIVLKTPGTFRAQYKVGEDTEAEWTRYLAHAKSIGGDAFGAKIRQTVEHRWRHADAVSLHCSHAYRSSYVLNFTLAGFAVLFGLLSVFWWNAEQSILIKGGFVLLEVALITWIILLTWMGQENRNDWHKRWLEARAFAELMRSGRTLALLGQTASSSERVSSSESSAWIQWLTRSTLREIPPPTGQINQKTLSIAIQSALEDELEGQIKYNEKAHKNYHHLDHALHHAGGVLFVITGVIGIAYLMLTLAYALHLVDLDKSGKDLIKASVTVLGAGLPAFGAALFGIKATGDFKVAAEQSKRTLNKLKSLKSELKIEHASPNAHSTLALLATLTSTLNTDLREWANIYELRELSLPG